MLQSIASRYARALFNLFSSEDEKVKALHDLLQIQELFKQHRKIYVFVLSPQIEQSVKLRVLDSTMSKWIDPKLLSFLNLLIEKRRFNFFNAIVSEFEHLVSRIAGALEAKLTTASPLDEKTKEQLIHTFENLLGRKLVVKTEVSPKLLGGGLFQVDNLLVDFSVKGKLDRLKEDLLSINVHGRS